jgi:hypothetical protein
VKRKHMSKTFLTMWKLIKSQINGCQKRECMWTMDEWKMCIIGVYIFMASQFSSILSLRHIWEFFMAMKMCYELDNISSCGTTAVKIRSYNFSESMWVSAVER